MRQQVKPWPNGLESRRKLKTWVYLRPCLTRVCVHLRWLAQTLVEFKFASKSTQDFHRLATQPKSTQVEWRIISQWNTRYVCRPGNVFFLRRACSCEETCQSVWPPNASLYASSTCFHLRLLTSPFGPGFNGEQFGEKVKIRLFQCLLP